MKITSIEPAKGTDKLVTGRRLAADVQYIRKGWADWYALPALERVTYWPTLEAAFDSYLVQQEYKQEDTLAVAIKARKTTGLMCAYCRETLDKRASVCLSCGSFLCLLCADEKCPTLGCV